MRFTSSSNFSGIVFGQTLINASSALSDQAEKGPKSKDKENSKSIMDSLSSFNSIVEMMITNVDQIFGDDERVLRDKPCLDEDFVR